RRHCLAIQRPWHLSRQAFAWNRKRIGFSVKQRVLDRVAASPGLADGTLIGLGSPAAFRKRDAVLLEQGALSQMNVGDRLVVRDNRLPIGDLGLGEAELRPEQQVEIDGALVAAL